MMDLLSSDVRPFGRLLSRWWRKQTRGLTELAISALDLSNHPDNALLSDLIVEVGFKDASTVTVKDVTIDTMSSFTPSHRLLFTEAQSSLKSQGHSTVMVMCTLLVEPQIPGRELTGSDLMLVDPPRRLVLNIRPNAMHLCRSVGLPCLNWKSRYIAEANGQPIPAKELPARTPISLIHETFKQASPALEAFIEARSKLLKTAFIQRMLAMKRSIQDSVLVVYLRRQSGTKVVYYANTVADYTLKDAKEIFTPAKLVEAKRDCVKFTARPSTSVPLVILVTVDTNFHVPVGMAIEASDVRRVSSSDPAAITNARDEAVWRTSLLQKLRA